MSKEFPFSRETLLADNFESIKTEISEHKYSQLMMYLVELKKLTQLKEVEARFDKLPMIACENSAKAQMLGEMIEALKYHNLASLTMDLDNKSTELMEKMEKRGLKVHF